MCDRMQSCQLNQDNFVNIANFDLSYVYHWCYNETANESIILSKNIIRGIFNNTFV